MIERFAQMPSALKANARWERFEAAGSSVPVMLVHPTWDEAKPVPVVLWMHGRTAHKELDPGRYLRWMRAGIGACAIDLPSHGERLEASHQDASHSLDVVRQVMGEIDDVVKQLALMNVFDMERLGIGGMSAGGMATMARLCRPHPFSCASVEATTGSWEHQLHREMFRGKSMDVVQELNPIAHLNSWREIPFQALHAKLDQWVSFQGQEEFVEALRARYSDPSFVEFITYEQTGAPHEHIGFGMQAADAKDRQRDFFRRWLIED